MSRTMIVNEFTVIIDDEHYELVSQFKWHIDQCDTPWPYAMTSTKLGRLKMEHLLLRYRGTVDHVNNNTLDNRLCNLRKATSGQNSANARLRFDNQVGYKGVKEHRGKYVARICYDYHRYHLGIFESSVEAARAYDRAALKYFGEFAKINFPEEHGLGPERSAFA